MNGRGMSEPPAIISAMIPVVEAIREALISIWASSHRCRRLVIHRGDGGGRGKEPRDSVSPGAPESRRKKAPRRIRADPWPTPRIRRLDPLSALEICRNCLRVHGLLDWAWKGGKHTLYQRCDCYPDHFRRTAWRGGPGWPGLDRYLGVELCRCCAAALIPAGRTRDPFYCEECLGQVLEHNGRAGRPILPVRQRVLDGGSGLVAGELRDGVDVLARTEELERTTEALRRWHVDQVRRQFERLDLVHPGRNVRLEVYFRALGAEPVDRLGCFVEMVGWVEGVAKRAPKCDRGERPS